jgi:hypothetical protein
MMAFRSVVWRKPVTETDSPGRDPYPPREKVYFATATFAISVTFELELASPSASAAN